MNDHLEETLIQPLSKEAIHKKRIEKFRQMKRLKVTRRIFLLIMISVTFTFLFFYISSTTYNWVSRTLLYILFVIGGYAFIRATEKIIALNSSIVELGDADTESCLEIQDWLLDETIRAFRDRVLDEQRNFTVKEVNDMRKFWENRSDRQASLKRKEEINEAFQKVYCRNKTTH